MDFSTMFSSPTFLSNSFAGDVTFLLFFIAVCIGLGMYLGRSRLVSVVIYNYIAVAILNVLPTSLFLFSLYGRVIVFFCIFAFLFFFGDYLLDIHISNTGSDFFWRILIMSFLGIGMLISIVLSLLPRAAALQYVSASSLGYFVSETAQMAWIILPLAFLIFINKRLR